MAERERFAHLLRRATFGPTAQEVDAAEKAGFAATVEALVAPGGEDPLGLPALGPDPFTAINRNSSREERQAARKARNEQVQQLTAWWLRRMATAKHQFSEKLVFFWHGHWATSVQKVDSAQLMLKQLNTFRTLGRGDFGALVKAMLRDPALIIWLDGQRNTREAPNENLARELMELFTLGIGGGYTENDVKAAARALTGWTLERTTGQVRLEPKRFDDAEKTILGRTGRFDADGLADLLVAQPVSPRFLASRLWFRFAQGDVVPAEAAQRMVSAYGSGRDVTAMARAMFSDPAFAATRGQLVKQPVEWLVGAVRQLEVNADRQGEVVRALNALDQVPLRPPSVGGWPSGAAWLTTFALQTKLRLAQSLAVNASAAVVDRLAAAPEAGRPEALARLLVVDGWSEATRKVLAPLKVPHRLLTMGLASPEYMVS
ncbi:MAG TPA: DUF1800 domain-containing protein [Candidatus Limnocylindrales bacterium]|nr:DUF1800 domain-containing protein [Candidatus Limnocylindrales bacterium]